MEHQGWTDSQDNWETKGRGETEEKGVSQDVKGGPLDLQEPLAHRDRSTRPQAALMEFLGIKDREDQVFPAGQDSQGLWDQREIQESLDSQDTQLRGRKENLVLSWGLMEDPCTWEGWGLNRERRDSRDLRDLLVPMVQLV